jgi:hypothetical protein
MRAIVLRSDVHDASTRGCTQGDSRAVVFRRKLLESNAGWCLQPAHVTRDHKPTLPSETRRILLAGACGSRVAWSLPRGPAA